MPIYKRLKELEVLPATRGQFIVRAVDKTGLEFKKLVNEHCMAKVRLVLVVNKNFTSIL